MAVAQVLKSEAGPSTINTGLDDNYRKEMSERLSGILSSTYQLVIKNHVYHWNVVGPLFKPIHELTETNYNALFKATDIIAERIRSLGHLAPASFSETSNFAPAGSDVDELTAHDMVKDLIKSHENSARALREAGEKAGDAGDLVTEDMVTERLAFHEETLWMLRAIIAE